MLYTRLSVPRGEASVVAPKLVFTRDAWTRLLTYCDAVQRIHGTEISGFGYVSMIGGMLYVADPSDVFITKQTVSPGSAEVEGIAYARAYDRAVVARREQDLRLQWHKHPGGLRRQSSTDMAQVESYATFGMDWMVSLVVADHEPCARVDYFRPIRIGCEVEVGVLDDVRPDVLDQIEREINELVTVKPVEELASVSTALVARVVKA